MKGENDIELMIEVAKYRYNQGLLEKQIAEKVEKTQPEISKLLKRAKRRGIIKETIDIVTPIDYEISSNVERKYKHLSKVSVVRYKGEEFLREELAKHAAQEIRKSLVSGTRVSLSCGTTVSAVLEALKDNQGGIKEIEVLPLLIVMQSKYEQPSPAGLVAECTKIFPGSTGAVIQFPEPKQNFDHPRDRLQQNEEAAKIKKFYEDQCGYVLQRASESKYMIIGIGSIIKEEINHSYPTYSFNHMIKELGLQDKIIKLGGKGECSHQPLTIDGEILMDFDQLEPLRSRLIYVRLQKLNELVKERKATILAVAGGKEKYDAILAATRAKVYNQIVTDIGTAEYLLEN